MKRPFVLINTNVIHPPVAPVGLEYVAEALHQAEVPLHIIDLAFEKDWRSALQREFSTITPLAAGLTVRNIDDSSFTTKRSFLPWIREIVTELKKLTGVPVIFGGVGFSIVPDAVLWTSGADAGICGDGEESTRLLAAALEKGEDFSQVPNIVYRDGPIIASTPRVDVDINKYPIPRRRLFDNMRYEQTGAQVGVETKRGCPQQCIFCADPVARGKTMRLRPVSTVIQELQDLVEQDISWLHLCDSEFNIPLQHAKEICEAIIQNRLANKLNWYCYCSPVPFDRELVRLMKRSGCQGINFGVDSLCDAQLYRLRRAHTYDDVARLVQILHEEKMNYMFDLLVGGPGESEETMTTTIEKITRLDVPLTGIAAGVRVYANTELGNAVMQGRITEGLYPDSYNLWEPVFYISPLLGGDPTRLIQQLIAGNPRFLFLSAPSDEESYNYADDDFLSNLIAEGARGAYWDIIRKAKKLA
jgi:radical SAM superfamily enzyme YgiQ (UPF0313 family)